jgi:hypothetical protein
MGNHGNNNRASKKEPTIIRESPIISLPPALEFLFDSLLVLILSMGITAPHIRYITPKVKNEKIDKKNHANLTIVESIFKYSARPPQTPSKYLSDDDLISFFIITPPAPL